MEKPELSTAKSSVSQLPPRLILLHSTPRLRFYALELLQRAPQAMVHESVSQLFFALYVRQLPKDQQRRELPPDPEEKPPALEISTYDTKKIWHFCYKKRRKFIHRDQSLWEAVATAWLDVSGQDLRVQWKQGEELRLDGEVQHLFARAIAQALVDLFA